MLLEQRATTDKKCNRPTLSTPESMFSFFADPLAARGIELLTLAGGLNDNLEPNEGDIPLL